MNESWHTYEWVCECSWKWMCHEWVMAHIWMSHGTHMNESWHTYEWVCECSWMWMCHEWVMAHIWMSHGTRMNESVNVVKSECVSQTWHIHMWYIHTSIWMWMCHIHVYKCVISHSRDTRHTNALWHTYKWEMAHIWMSHGTHMNVSYLTHETRDIRMSQGKNDRSLLQTSPIKETIFCKRDTYF